MRQHIFVKCFSLLVILLFTVGAQAYGQLYTITSSAGTDGTILPSGTKTFPPDGSQSQTYTISANTGYHIASVLVDGASKGAITSYTFSRINGNHTITATFAINIYTITVQQSSGGTISPGTSFVTYGGSKTFTITPNTGYHISGVNVDGGTAVGAVSSYTFSNVNFNHLITAGFTINTYILNYTAGANGTISGTSLQTVNYGSSGTAVTAVANTGYHFVQWS